MPRSGAAPAYRPVPHWRPGSDSPVAFALLVSDRRCELRCYPRDDPQFEIDVQNAIQQSRRLGMRGDGLLAQVRNRMTSSYPSAVIQPRHPLAGRTGEDDLWYCYRDGRLLPPNGTEGRQ